ncbi:Glutamyl aminopeptidase [Manis javanica]|nr:Glutamyl aminopeptidase [Manis javanica]
MARRWRSQVSSSRSEPVAVQAPRECAGDARGEPAGDPAASHTPLAHQPPPPAAAAAEQPVWAPLVADLQGFPGLRTRSKIPHEHHTLGLDSRASASVSVLEAFK